MPTRLGGSSRLIRSKPLTPLTRHIRRILDNALASQHDMKCISPWNSRYLLAQLLLRRRARRRPERPGNSINWGEQLLDANKGGKNRVRLLGADCDHRVQVRNEGNPLLRSLFRPRTERVKGQGTRLPYRSSQGRFLKACLRLPTMMTTEPCLAVSLASRWYPRNDQ